MAEQTFGRLRTMFAAGFDQLSSRPQKLRPLKPQGRTLVLLLFFSCKGLLAGVILHPTDRLVSHEQMVVESRLHRELQLRSLMSVQSDNDSHRWNLRGY